MSLESSLQNRGFQKSKPKTFTQKDGAKKNILMVYSYEKFGTFKGFYFEINAICGVHFSVIEKVFKKLNHGIQSDFTLGVELFEVKERIQLFSERDIGSTLQTLTTRFNEKGTTLYNGFKTLEDVNSYLNSNPNTKCEYSLNSWMRATKGLIAAFQCKTHDVKNLENEYRAILQKEPNSAFYVERFDTFCEELGQIMLK